MDKAQTRHKLISLVLAILYPISLGLFAFPIPVFRYIMGSLLAFLILIGFYNWFYIKSQKLEPFWPTLGVVMFYGAWACMFLIAPTYFLQISFLIISLILGYFVERLAASVGEDILFGRLIVTAFAFFISASAITNYYFKLPGIIVLSGVFIFTLALARVGYEQALINAPAKLVNALVVALLSVELFWVLSFLPFHYSVLGMMVFLCFFCIWQLNYYFIFERLHLNKIVLLVGLSVLFCALAFALTPWRLVS